MPRPNKPWFRKSTGWWMVTINGQFHKLAKGAQNKEAARIRFHELMLERIANPPVDDGNPTVASLAEAYLASIYGSLEVGIQAFRDKSRYLQDFAERFGRRLARELKPFHIDEWIKAHPNWRSPETKSDAVKHVKRVFNWALDSGLILTNPIARAKTRFGMNRRCAIAVSEIKSLLDALTPRASDKPRFALARLRLRELILFLSNTGARPSEARALRWSDVDSTRPIVVLREHKTVRSQRVPRPRVIDLVPEMVDILSQIRARGDHDEFVFVNGAGKPWNKESFNQAFRRIRVAANLPEKITPYTIRHGFGTRATTNGIGIATVASLMGHTSTRTTERYLHLDEERQFLRDAMIRAASGCPKT